MATDQTPYEIFISYARRDNQAAAPGARGWVTALRDKILDDHGRFSTAPLRMFLDEGAIRDMDDWRQPVLGVLRESEAALGY